MTTLKEVPQNENPELQKFVDSQIADILPIEQTSIELKAKADGTNVDSDETLTEAVKLRKEITSHISSTAKKRLEMTRPLDNVKDQLIAGERRVLAPAEEAKSSLGQKIMSYEEAKAEAARKEQARVDAIISNFAVSGAIQTKKITNIDERGKDVKEYYAHLPEADQQLPQIKLAFTKAINDLLDARAILSKAQVDADQAERDRLTRNAAEIEAAAEVESAERQQAKSAPKAGIKTVTRFRVVNHLVVPREYCLVDQALIRAAIAGGVTEIPGVEIYQERSF